MAIFKETIERLNQNQIEKAKALNSKDCKVLEDFLKGVNQKLSNTYDLSEETIKSLENDKTLFESKIAENKCEEQKAIEYNRKLKESEQQLINVQQDQEAQKKKTLLYVGAAIGGVVVIVVLYKLLKK
jgi:hypothetical protein